MRTYLFIGGCWDGLRRETGGQHLWKVAPRPVEFKAEELTRVETYQAHRVRGEISLYYPEGWTIDQLVEALSERIGQALDVLEQTKITKIQGDRIL